MIEITSYKSYTELKIFLNDLLVDSPFLDLHFFEALEYSKSIGGVTGWKSFPIVATKDKEVVGFIPIFLKSHSYGEYVFDWSWAEAFESHGLSYYPKMISAIPFTPITGKRIVSKDPEIKKLMIKALEKILVEHKISSCHILFPEKEDSDLFTSMGWLYREGIQFKWENKLYSSFNNFLSDLSHNKRKKIKQERRKIIESGIKVDIKTGTEIEKEDIDFFYLCYCKTYELHRSSPYLTKEFFFKLFESMPDKLVFIFARRNNENIASALNIIGADTLYGRYWGAIEYVPNLHFELCYYQGQEFCIDNKINYFEGGAQGEHKLARGFKPFKTFSNHFIANKDFSSAINDFLDKEVNHMNIYANELDERSPFKK
jgi:predicted N-acyltransferase